MNWLLLFVPVAIGLEFLAPDRHLLIFVTSSLALLPLLRGWAGPPNGLRHASAKELAGFSTRLSATPLN